MQLNLVTCKDLSGRASFTARACTHRVGQLSATKPLSKANLQICCAERAIGRQPHRVLSASSCANYCHVGYKLLSDPHSVLAVALQESRP